MYKLILTGIIAFTSVFVLSSCLHSEDNKETPNGIEDPKDVDDNDSLAILLDAPLIWKNEFKNYSLEFFHSVIEINDGSLLAVGATKNTENGDQNVLLSKFSSNGNLIWSYNYGSENKDEYGIEMAKANGNGVIIVGQSEALDGNSAEGIILSVDSLGNQDWLKYYPENSINIFYTISQISSGNYFVGGGHGPYYIGGGTMASFNLTSYGTISNSNTFQFESHSSMIDSYVLSNGDVFMLGFGIPFQEPIRPWVAKMHNSDYYPDWIEGFYSEVIGQIFATSLAMSHNGNLIVAGGIQNPTDYSKYIMDPLVITFDVNTGDTLSMKTLSNPAKNNLYYDFEPTRDGGYIAVGTAEDSDLQLADNILINKLNSRFELEWEQIIQSDSLQSVAFDVIQTSDGKYVTVGKMNGGSVDPISFNSGSYGNAFILKFE